MSYPERIFLNPPHQTGQELAELQKVLSDNFLAPVGPSLDGFEKDLSQRLETPRPVLGLNSGTSAIHLALRMIGVGPGDLVFCPSFTFAGSAFPITYCGAEPVFIDCNSDGVNLDPELLEQGIKWALDTGRTIRAIIAVHLYGFAYEVSAINDIAQRYGIPVIEDAAEALGSRHQGQACGTLGDYGILSFNGNKIITTAGGGALICKTEQERKQAHYLAQQAKLSSRVYEHETVGYNYRMSNLCAALGRAQLTGLDQRLHQKKEINRRYVDIAQQYNGISIYTLEDHLIALDDVANHQSGNDASLSDASTSGSTTNQQPNYWLNILRIDPEVCPLTPAQVIDQFEAHNIEARYVWKPMHLQPVFKQAKSFLKGSSEYWFNHSLCLPSGTAMTQQDWDRIEQVFKACFKPLV